MNTDYALNEKRIAQELIARNLAGLFEWLLDLKGFTLNQSYTLRWLYAVGGQSILYIADSPSRQEAIVKMALLPYHRAAYVSTEDIHKTRQRVVREADLLKRFQGTMLPKFYDLIYAINLLHSPVRGEEIVNHEPFLVMEMIHVHVLQKLVYIIHRAHQLEILEWIAWQVALTATDFSMTILAGEDPYLYSDFTSSNIIITDDPNKSIRILDASSLVPLHANPTIPPPFTRAYIPPEYFKAYREGKYLWPTPHYVMYILGKVLWQILVNEQLSVGEDPDLSKSELKNYSQPLQNLIVDLIKRRYDSFGQLKQSIESSLVSGPNLRSSLLEFLSASSGADSERLVLIGAVPTIQPSGFIKNRRPIKVKESWTEGVRMLRYSPDGQHIAIALQNRVELRDAHTLDLEKQFKSERLRSIISLDFDSAGQYLASGSLEGHAGQYLASGSLEGHAGLVSLWHIDTGDTIWEQQVMGFNGHVALDARADLLAAATKWSVATFHPQRAVTTGRDFDGIVDKDTSLAIGKRRLVLAVGGYGGIQLWNLQRQSEFGLLKVDSGMFVERITFGNKDQTIAALISNTHDLIMVWDLPSRRLLWQVETSSSQVTDISLVAEGQLVAAVSLDGYLWVWNWKHKVEYARLTNCGRVSTLNFAPHGQTLAVATADGQICIYRLNM